MPRARPSGAAAGLGGREMEACFHGTDVMQELVLWAGQGFQRVNRPCKTVLVGGTAWKRQTVLDLVSFILIS